ncbi:BPI fold-containing family C protein-like [Mantella aurantiaca]
MLLAGYVLFIVLSLFNTCNADNPGIKVRLMENVLEESVQYLVDSMTADISSYNLPDVNGSATLDSDEMIYELSNIQIMDFQFGNVSSKFIPGTGAQIVLHHGYAVINCQCDLDSWLVKDSGLAVLTLSGTSIIMIMGVRRVDPGVPSVLMLDCQAFIRKIDFKMLSGISYVYDALKPHIEEVLRRTVTQQLCSALRSQVFGWDVFFNHLNMNFTFSPNIEADLSLISDPEISEKYADLNLKGQFRASNANETSYSPAPFTLPTQPSARSCAGISEASINSLVDAYYSSGSMNAMLSDASDSINVTTSELTAAVPEISKHVNSPTPVKIILYATSSPKVNLTGNNITMDFQGLFQIHARPTKDKSQVLLETRILAVLNGEISISDGERSRGLNLSASISLNRLQIDKTGPKVKEPKDATSEKGIQHIISHWLVPNINEKLKKGMLISSRILENPSKISYQGFELVEMDFSLD